MASRWLVLILALSIVALAPACGGHSSTDPATPTQHPSAGNGSLAGVPGLPLGEPAGKVNKGTSSYKFMQTDLLPGSVGASMTGSQLTLTEPGAGSLSYAILGVNTGGQYPPSLTITGTLAGLYVGVSDYSRGTWKWLGGAHSAAGLINLPAAGTLSGGGSIYIALVCPAGASADISVDLDITTASDTWNLMVWIAGDNSLAQDAVVNLNDMESVGSTDKVNILVGYDIDPSQNLGVTGLEAVHFIKVVQDSNPNSINVTGDPKNESFDSANYNSADPAHVLEFINWAQTNFPATHNALVLWDHGDGWMPGWKGVASLRGWQANRRASGLLADDRNGAAMLTDNEYIAQVLSGKHFDLLCFDACNMAHIEALYDYRGLADWMSASEALFPGLGYPYGNILTAWNSATAPNAQAVAKIFADETFNFYKNNEAACQATIKATEIDPLTAALNALVAEVVPKGAAESSAVQQAINSSLAPMLSDGEADLGQFLAAYKAATSDPAVEAKLDAALSAYSACATYFKQFQFDGATGITAYLPKGSYFSQGYQDMYSPKTFNVDTNWLGMLQAAVAPPVTWGPGDKIEIAWASSNADMDLVMIDPYGNMGGPWDTFGTLLAEMDFSPDNPNGGGTNEWAKLKASAPLGDYTFAVGFNYFNGSPPATYDVTVKLYDSGGVLKRDLGVCTVPYYNYVDYAILKY